LRVDETRFHNFAGTLQRAALIYFNRSKGFAMQFQYSPYMLPLIGAAFTVGLKPVD